MKRWLDILVPATLLIAAIWLRIDNGALIERARLIIFDSYQALAPREYQPLPVQIVDIDEESLEKIGQWPWSRTIIAKLVDRLRGANAAVVGFDILFAEPDRTSPRQILNLYQDAVPSGSVRDAILGLPDPDQKLATSLSQIPSVGVFTLGNQSRADQPYRKAGFSFTGDDPRLFVSGFSGATAVLEIFEQAYSGIGFANYLPDQDGIARRIPLIAQYENELYPSFVAELLRVAQGASGYIVKSSGASSEVSFGKQTGITSIRVGNAIIPTDPSGSILLYDSGHKSERFLPAWWILSDNFDPQAVAGKIILIGTSASGLRDIRATPLSPNLAGVEVHAQLIEQILTSQYLYRPDWANGVEVIYLALVGIIMIVLIRKSSAAGAAAVGFCVVAASVILSWLGFQQEKLLVDPFTPGIAALAVYLSGSLLGYLKSESDRRQIRSAFGQYVSPALVDRLSRNPNALRLGGEMRELTLLFCDIRGFTEISEKLSPEALTKLINSFLTPMTGIIQAQSGTIDKYIGDCIMAFWNAPLDDPDHVAHGLDSALAMRAELLRLNESWAEAANRSGTSFAPLRVGIGLNTGRCSVGNFGSEQRFDYSALGDTVNLASRIESLSRIYGLDIIVGSSTAAAAIGYALVEIDRVRVKGRKQPEAVFALLGDRVTAELPIFTQFRDRFHVMLEDYRSRRWEQALLGIEALRIMPGDLPVDVEALLSLWEYRINQSRETPPAAGWDGVFTAETKTG